MKVYWFLCRLNPCQGALGAYKDHLTSKESHKNDQKANRYAENISLFCWGFMANLSENYLVQVDIQIAPSVIQQRFQPPQKKKKTNKKTSLY